MRKWEDWESLHHVNILIQTQWIFNESNSYLESLGIHTLIYEK